MKRIIFTLIILILTLNFIAFASESRVSSLAVPSTLVDDYFGMVLEPWYVNSTSNFVVFEPITAPLSFYALAKYTISTPIEQLNLGVIINYPYYELSYIPNIATGIPTGFLRPGTTPLSAFTLTDYSKDRIDVLLGLNKILLITFLKPYLGIGYAGDFLVTTTSNEASGTETITEESISQIKIILGSTVDLGFISLSPTIKVYLPSAVNSASNLSTNVQNYVNYRYHSLLSSFNFSVDVPLKLKLDGDKTYIKGFVNFFNYYLPSAQITKRDLNGNGNFGDPGDEDTQITNNYGVVSYKILGSYNTYILNNILILLGTGYSSTTSSREIYARGVANATQTNDNDYKSYTTEAIIPIFVSTEIPFTDWLTFRVGVAGNPLEITYSYTKNGKDGQATVNILSSSSLLSSFTIGFSVKPIKGLSLDWVLNDTFINNVFINGRLPWIISGNNLFDRVSSKFSIEWVF
jgi:hypothetical protein